MKCIILIPIVLVIAINTLSCGGGKVTTGPGDPKLTYDLVIQNLEAYRGRRVRWYGTRMSIEFEDVVSRITFMNGEPLQARGDIQAFVVEYRPGKRFSELPENGWVTGTIEGTHTVSITLRGPGGETHTSKAVPLLTHAEIEEVIPSKK